MQKTIDGRNKTILIIGDLHLPYSHKDFLKFLSAVKKKYLDRNSIIISIGDELDYHAVSFHDSIADLLSAGDELKQALRKIAQLEKIFPKMYLLESNHGSLLFRRMRKHGLPIKILQSLSTLYKTPQWEWHNEIILKTNHHFPTYICHGKTATYNKLAREVGMNAIQGHYHSKFEITWQKTAVQERYNAFCGCLIDDYSLAFEYGRNNLPKAIHGVIIIDKHGLPHLIKMNLTKKNKWDGRINGI